MDPPTAMGRGSTTPPIGVEPPTSPFKGGLAEAARRAASPRSSSAASPPGPAVRVTISHAVLMRRIARRRSQKQRRHTDRLRGLVRRRRGFIRGSTDLIDPKDLTESYHQSVIELFTLIAKDLYRGSKTWKHLLNQGRTDSSGFLVRNRKRFGEFGKMIYICQNVAVPSTRPGVSTM